MNVKDITQEIIILTGIIDLKSLILTHKNVKINIKEISIFNNKMDLKIIIPSTNIITRTITISGETIINTTDGKIMGIKIDNIRIIFIKKEISIKEIIINEISINIKEIKITIIEKTIIKGKIKDIRKITEPKKSKNSKLTIITTIKKIFKEKNIAIMITEKNTKK